MSNEDEAGTTANRISGDAYVAGSVVQAGSVHGGIHQHHHAAPAQLPMPDQLPHPARHFTDRMEARQALETARTPREDPARVVVISGLGGSGKTALAVKWLTELREEFPGGLLHADLRGSGHGSALPPGVILGQWLRAFGLGPAPADPGEAAALWRSVTARRAVAVLVDDAARSDQVRPLMPGRAGLMVVTSRRTLTGLAADGAVVHQLGPLEDGAAAELLGRYAGPERIAADPDAVRRLTAVCGRLPLPLVLAGARLVTQPHRPLAHLCTTLTNPRPNNENEAAMDALDRAVDDAYRSLPPEIARTFRLLAVLPTTDVDPAAASAACGLPLPEAGHHLEALADEQLLVGQSADPVRGGVSYQLADGVRQRALDHAQTQESTKERSATVRRLADWYLAVATATQKRLTPAQFTLRRSQGAQTAALIEFDSDRTAVAWLDAHQHHLMSVLRAGADAGWHDLVWQLVDAMWPLFMRLHPYDLWIEAHVLGREAARQAQNAAAERQMLLSGAIGLSSAGRNDEAIRWYGEALEAARAAGEVRDEGQALLGLGSCHHAAGQRRDGARCLEEAVTRWEACGYPRGVALAETRQGEAALDDGEARLAIRLLSRAHRTLTEVDDPFDAARAQALRGHAYAQISEHRAAMDDLQQALATVTAAGSRAWQARIHDMLGQACQTHGERDTARHHYRTAITLYETSSPARAARVRGRLTDL
ncbi:regulator [Streptomyces sp. NPDC056672]|uniref:regulator n=1 Tax=Streptomyces sp. NPDC056672 TaxID=3345906 RepID=UPI00369801C2